MSAPRDPNLIDEQSFEDYLKRGSPLSQRYREASDDEPPAALDQRVLDAARDAVEKSPARTAPSKSRPNWMRWSAPLALAASAVLVLSIVIESGVQQESATLTAPAATRAPRAEQAPSAPEPALHDHAEYERVYAAPAEAQVELAADVAEEAPVETTAAPPSREEKAVTRAPVERAPQPRFAPPPPAPAAAVAAPAESAAAGATSSRDLSRAATEARSDAELSEVVISGAQRARATARASGPRNTVRGLSAPASEEFSRAETGARTPEEWLEDIRELRKESRNEEADREWDEFRRAYPDFPVEASDAAQRAGAAER